VLSVTSAVPISLVVTPSSAAVLPGAQQQFSATLNYSNGSSQNVTSSVTWSSLTPGVATVSSGGLALGVSTGSCTIEAVWGGNSLTATTTLTVLSPPVVVTPAVATIAIGGTQQFAAAVNGNSNQTVTWSVDGFSGGSNAGGIGIISATGLYTAAPTAGSHTVTATSQANGSTGSSTIRVLSIVASVPAVPYFGIDYNVGTPFSSNPISHGVGRLWDTPGAEWSFVQTVACATSPCPNSFNWATVDSTLSVMETNSVYTAQVVLSRTPNFASSNASDTKCNYYKSGGVGGTAPGQCDPPKDLNSDGTGPNQYWRDWVAAYAAHVNAPGYTSTHARVAYWEIWNEPDSVPFWTGTMDQLIRMQEDAYCIIKGGAFAIRATGETCTQVRSAVKSVAISAPIDPTALVLMPSYHPTNVGLQMAQAFLYCTGSASGSHCDVGGHATTDVINFHTKPGSSYPTSLESVMNTWTSNIKGLLQPAESAKPLFGTEGGYAASGWVAPYTTDLNQAAFIARFYIYLYSKGYANNVWYAYNTTINGLGSVAANTAYSQVFSGLVGATSLACSVSANGTADSAQPSLYTCTFTEPDGTPAQWMWDNDNTAEPAFWDTGAANNLECHSSVCPTHVQPVPAAMLTYVDLTGVKTSITGGQVPVGIRPILVQAKP